MGYIKDNLKDPSYDQYFQYHILPKKFSVSFYQFNIFVGINI